MAYQTCLSTREQSQIYVQEAANASERWRVSPDGGAAPRWPRSGREIFYPRGNKLFASPVTLSPKFTTGPAVESFEAGFPWKAQVEPYDAAPDGQRFLVIANLEVGPPQLVVVPDWVATLKARPTP